MVRFDGVMIWSRITNFCLRFPWELWRVSVRLEHTWVDWIRLSSHVPFVRFGGRRRLQISGFGNGQHDLPLGYPDHELRCLSPTEHNGSLPWTCDTGLSFGTDAMKTENRCTCRDSSTSAAAQAVNAEQTPWFPKAPSEASTSVSHQSKTRIPTTGQDTEAKNSTGMRLCRQKGNQFCFLLDWRQHLLRDLGQWLLALDRGNQGAWRGHRELKRV